MLEIKIASTTGKEEVIDAMCADLTSASVFCGGQGS